MEQIHGTSIAWSVYHGGFNREDLCYVRELHRKGITVASNFPTMQGSIGVYPDEKFLRETACKDINGNPVRAQWIQPDPPYLPCNNNPKWKNFLKERILEHINGEADAIHFDEVEGIAGHLYSAGFDEYCIQGFKEYLKNKYSKEQLSKMGISDIDSFDYKNYLLSIGAKGLKDDPSKLKTEFVRFQLESRYKQIKELITYAKSNSKRNIMFTANTFFLSENKQHFIQDLDYAVFENEINFPPEGKYIGTYLLGRAIGEKSGKKNFRLVMFPTIIDLKILTESQKDWILIPHRLLEAVASGETFLIPYNAYTFGGGIATVTGNATVPLEILKPYTDFLWKYSEYLTDANPVADVGIIYDFPTALSEYIHYGYESPWVPGYFHRGFLGLTIILQEGHIPFGVVYIGDGDFVKNTSIDDIYKYKLIIVPSSEKYKEVFENYKKGGGKIIQIDYSKGLEYFKERNTNIRGEILSEIQKELTFPQIVTASSSEYVSISVWEKGNLLLINLINYNYDKSIHSFKSEKVKLFLNFNPKNITVLSPDSIANTYSGKEISVEIKMYALIVVEQQ